MYVQLIDKHNFTSPILYIHCDKDEFMGQIEKWKTDLLQWIEENPEVKGLPLGRLEPNICMTDLIRHLTSYYAKVCAEQELPEYFQGRIPGTLHLMNDSYLSADDFEEVIRINLHEETS